MKMLLLGSLLACGMMVSASAHGADKPKALAFTVNSLEGKPVDLSQYAGKVVLIVNVASECGLTGQYEALQALHEKYGEEGLVVLGFPCNQFGGQEPGSAAEIRQFCTREYNVTFPLFAKIDVNGDDAAPLYKHLTAADVKPQGAGKIGWNFEKFVIDRQGNVTARFSPRTAPDDAEVLQLLEAELAKK